MASFTLLTGEDVFLSVECSQERKGSQMSGRRRKRRENDQSQVFIIEEGHVGKQNGLGSVDGWMHECKSCSWLLWGCIRIKGFAEVGSPTISRPQSLSSEGVDQSFLWFFSA